MDVNKVNQIIKFIKKTYAKNNIFLHEPKFVGNEKKYLKNCIESGYFSSVGEYVEQFEKKISEYTNSKYTILVVNGTEALHIALLLLGVNENDEVITQPVSFVATANAIHYTGAAPVFVDVDMDTLSLSPEILEDFILKNYDFKNDVCYNYKTGKVLKTCIPVHIFGHPGKIYEI